MKNLVGVAAGLASTGVKSFCSFSGLFLTARALEQIKNDVAYSDNPVRWSASAQVLAMVPWVRPIWHDFAVLRTIHNMTIVAPADAYETEQTVRQSVQIDSPVYLRFGKKNMALLPNEINQMNLQSERKTP